MKKSFRMPIAFIVLAILFVQFIPFALAEDSPTPSLAIFVEPGQSVSYQVKYLEDPVGFSLDGTSDFEISPKGIISNTTPLVEDAQYDFMTKILYKDHNLTKQTHVFVHLYSTSPQSLDEHYKDGRSNENNLFVNTGCSFDAFSEDASLNLSKDINFIRTTSSQICLFLSEKSLKSTVYEISCYDSSSKTKDFTLNPSVKDAKFQDFVLTKDFLYALSYDDTNTYLDIYSLFDGSLVSSDSLASGKIEQFQIIDNTFVYVIGSSVYFRSANTDASSSALDVPEGSSNFILALPQGIVVLSYEKGHDMSNLLLFDYSGNKLFSKQFNNLSPNSRLRALGSDVFFQLSDSALIKFSLDSHLVEESHFLSKDFSFEGVSPNNYYFSKQSKTNSSIVAIDRYSSAQVWSLPYSLSGNFILTGDQSFVLAKDVSNKLFLLGIDNDGSIFSVSPLVPPSFFIRGDGLVYGGDILYVVSSKKIQIFNLERPVVQDVKSSDKKNSYIDASIIAGCSNDHTTFVVVDSADGSPLSGALVKATSSIGSFSCQTGDDGYCFIDLPKSSYTVVISKSGFEQLTSPVSIERCSPGAVGLSDEEVHEKVNSILTMFSQTASENMGGSSDLEESSSTEEVVNFGSSDVQNASGDFETAVEKTTTVLNFKSGSAFSLFVLLLVLLLVVVAAYVKHKMKASKLELVSLEEKLEEKLHPEEMNLLKKKEK